MSLIIADRVKETTTTQGTGTVTLSGPTFGGFQSFSSAIGEGNTTYYCIQNESNFEIGIGTYSSSTLSRDTVLSSSNSDSRISITGAAVIFCVVPSEKLLYKDTSGSFSITGSLSIDDLNADYILANSGNFNGPLYSNSFSSIDISANNITSSGSLNSSGLLTLRRESAGNFFHAYIDDSNDRTISLYSDGVSPIWRLGLKNSPSNETTAPSYGYVSAGDSHLALVGSDDNKITLSNTSPFCVTHQGVNVINAHYMTGVHLNSISSSYPALVVNGGAALSANIQEWDSYGGTTLSVVDSDGNFGVGNNNPSYQLDVTGTGSFSQAVRFGDGSIQTSAALPFSSGQLIDQNKADIITVSGLLYNDSAISGYFESHIDNLGVDIVTVSGLLYNDASLSGYFESRVDVADSSITANSGYFESRANIADSNLSTVSGLLTPSGESFDFSANVLTYSNSDGGSFAADLSSLSTFDTSGVSLGYSAGNLTYTNNAGGTFSVDLSSISGDVYAMIVGGAPSTLDTLNEIAAALNDDENIATTLTSLISTTSGNLQSQITSNDTDIATNVASIDTVSGLLYDDAAISGYFESRVDDNQSNISTNTSNIATKLPAASGAVITAVSGYFESRVDSADSNISTNSSSITANSGYFESRVDSADSSITANSGYFESRVDSADSSITANSGYFESRVDTNAADIITVSGLTSGGGGGGTTHTAGSGLTLAGDEFNVYGGSGNFEYIELQTDNTTVPKLKFTGSGVTDTPITLEVRSSYESVSESGSALLFQGSQGQLFSITDNLSSGVIFSVADIAGLPMLEVDASGHVHIGEYADNITSYKPILISGGVPTSTTNKLYNDAGTLHFNGSALGSAVSAVANGVDNRVVTFSSTDALNGEANLTFNGSTLAVNGAFTATTKSFLIDHPTKEDMKLQYASLEGPENGVYIRGTSGSNLIALPEYWSTLVDQSTVTVTLTSIGYYQPLYIKEKGKNYIKVGGCKGSYDYVVYGERKDVEKLKVEW
jgi:hypothetical protein